MSNLKKRIFIDWAQFATGLVIMSLGISLVTQSGLGTTPISALPLVSSYAFAPLTFGETTLIINVVLVLLQWILLRKRARWTLLLQIPVTFLFSISIDFWMHHTEVLRQESYWLCWVVGMSGNILLALGVSLEVRSGALVLPGEGIVVAASVVLNKPFPKMKIVNDVLLVSLALLLSLLCFSEIRGLREGTIVSALVVGLFVKFWTSCLNRTFGPKLKGPQSSGKAS